MKYNITEVFEPSVKIPRDEPFTLSYYIDTEQVLILLHSPMVLLFLLNYEVHKVLT